MNPQQRQAFLDTLTANEDDTATRWIYADWLDEQNEHEEADRMRKWPAAKAWMVEFAASLGGTGVDDDEENYYGPYREITYEDVIQAGRDFVANDDYFVQQGSELARSRMHEAGTKELYWRNWSVLTGIAVDDKTKQGTVFSCSC